MKYKKTTLLASLMLSVALLTACTGNDKEDVKGEVDNPTNVQVEQTSVDQSTVNGSSSTSAKAQTTKKFIPDGLKMGGNETNGYVLIPEEFANFVDPNVPNGTASQYAKPDMSLIVTIQNTDKSLTLSEATKVIAQNLGDSAKTKDVTIGQFKAVEIYQAYPEENYHLYSYLLDTDKGVRFVSIEFSGDDIGLREEIINTYSTTPYSDTKPAEEAIDSEDEKAAVKEPIVEKPLNDNLSSSSKNLEVKQVSKNEFEFVLRGDFEVGVEYVVGVYNDVQFDGLANKRFAAQTDDKGTYISGVVEIDKDLVKANYNINILHGKTYEVVAKDLYFKYK